MACRYIGRLLWFSLPPPSLRCTYTARRSSAVSPFHLAELVCISVDVQVGQRAETDHLPSPQTCTLRLYIASPSQMHPTAGGINRSTHVLRPALLPRPAGCALVTSHRWPLQRADTPSGETISKSSPGEEWGEPEGGHTAFMGNSPSSSSHERGTNGLTVEMRGEERENQCFCWGKERKAFTGLCIIKQLRKLIRVWGGGGYRSHSNYFHGNRSSCRWSERGFSQEGKRAILGVAEPPCGEFDNEARSKRLRQTL